MARSFAVIALLMALAAGLALVGLVSLDKIMPLPGRGLLLVALPGMAALAVPYRLTRSLQRLWKLRDQGQAESALQSLPRFRLVLPPRTYHGQRSVLLIQAGQFEEAARALRHPSLSPAQSEHLRFALCLAQKQHDEAEAALRRAVELSPEPESARYRLELAVHLAIFSPSHLPEAFQELDLALRSPLPNQVQPLFLGVEGLLLLVGGEYESGQQILRYYLPKVELLGPDFRTWVGSFHRWMAWADRALGRESQARAALVEARGLISLPQYTDLFDQDLRLLDQGQPWLTDPGPQLRAYCSQRAAGHKLLTRLAASETDPRGAPESTPERSLTPP